jgi:hypothetical protein
MRIEQTPKERQADPTIQFDSPLNVPRNGPAARDDNQGTDLFPRQVSTHLHEHVGRVFRWPVGGPAAGAPTCDSFEQLTQFFLKDHHQNDEEDGKEALE